MGKGVIVEGVRIYFFGKFRVEVGDGRRGVYYDE